jgi:RimJ/RimL family protein N-acetyltransferase
VTDSDPYAEVQRLIREGQPKTALPLAEKCTVQYPQSAKAWAQLGQVLVLLQQMPAARLALDKALALDAHLTTAVMAMAAVCLEQGHDAQAIEFLRKGMADPQLPWAMWLRSAHHMMQALVRCGLLEQARLCLQAVQDKLTATGAAAPEWLASSQWRLATCWWEPRQTARIRIRRAMPDDAAWLKQSFANTDFGDAVNRDYAQRLKRTELTQLAAQLAHQYRLPPADQGAMLWLIERHDQQPAKVLGLASFTNIDSHNLRAEFIIGFPGARPAGGLVLEASALLADFAFDKSGAGFHKVCASVYADNPRASDLLDILVRVGFQQEGVLREQVKLASGNYVDLKVLGGIRAAVTGNPAMQQITRRYLGRELL